MLKDSITRLSWLDLSSLEMKISFMALLQWLLLVLLSQNIEELVSLVIQTAFSATFMGFEIYRIWGTNLWHHNRVAEGQRIVLTRGNLLTVQIITVVLSITHSMTTIVHCWVAYHGRQHHASFPHMVFLCSQAMTWSLSLLLISFEKRSGSSSHHFLLRGWWVSSFILWVYEMLSRAASFMSDNSHSFHIIFNDSILFATLPLISTLLAIAIQGSIKVVLMENSDTLSKNLLTDKLSFPQKKNSGTLTSYAGSGFISRLTFFWLNSLLAA